MVKGMGSRGQKCQRTGSEVEVWVSSISFCHAKVCETEGRPLYEEQRTEKEILKELMELNLLEEGQ